MTAFAASILALLISALFVQYPNYASALGWKHVANPREALSLLLYEPAGWMILAFSVFLFLLLLVFVLTPPGEITLMPDRLIIRDGSSIVEVPYWQIERVWMKKGDDGRDWLILEGAFSRMIRLPLEGEHFMVKPTRRALPELLRRLPTWTRVSPEVKHRASRQDRRR